MVFGAAGVWRSLDGVAWQMTPEKAFKGYDVSAVTTVADGDLLAAGQQAVGSGGSKLATWMGTPAASPSP